MHCIAMLICIKCHFTSLLLSLHFNVNFNFQANRSFPKHPDMMPPDGSAQLLAALSCTWCHVVTKSQSNLILNSFFLSFMFPYHQCWFTVQTPCQTFESVITRSSKPQHWQYQLKMVKFKFASFSKYKTYLWLFLCFFLVLVPHLAEFSPLSFHLAEKQQVSLSCHLQHFHPPLCLFVIFDLLFSTLR